MVDSLRQFLILLCYALPALALGLWLPQWLPLIDRPLAIAIGAAVLIGGGLLQEVRARRARDGAIAAQMLELRQALFHAQEDLLWTRRELTALSEAVEAGGPQAHRGERPAVQEVMADALDAVARWDQSGRAVEEVMAEVHALKSLVAQVAQRETPAAQPVERVAVAAGGRRAAGAAALADPAEEPLLLKPLPKDTSEDAILDAVRAALRDDRVDLALQPIVALPSRRRQFYEAYSRLRDAKGGLLLPEQYLAIAERRGHITAIDNMILLRCIQLVRKVRRQGEDYAFFCNVSPYTLKDRAFLADIVDFLDKNRDLAAGLIFEFAQRDLGAQGPEEIRLLDRLVAIGCRLAIDQVTRPDLDPIALARRGIRFVKIDAAAMLEAAAADFDAPRRLQDGLARRGLELIVEKIETEPTLIELLDHDIEYGQGFLFGEPRQARPAD